MIQLRSSFFLLVSFYLFLPLMVDRVYAQNEVNKRSLTDVIHEVQEETGFRVLYREALVSGITVDGREKNGYSLASFRNLLNSHNLDIKIDSAHSQAVIVKREIQPRHSSPNQKVRISGHVVDAASGERLPYATITWKNNGRIKGISADNSGSYQVNFPVNALKIELTCSYVGYLPETIELEMPGTSTLDEVTFRLQPQRIDGNELVVTGTNYYNQVNQNASGLVDIGTFSPLGNSNTIRALQSLPSTTLSPALSGDMHVRGSPSDGFQVLIDGITVFNQSHLFGLLDSFNADALKRSGFFYDIAPAQYQAPPGGTLSMVTQTGSLNKFSATAGASNTSYRLTLEGPLKKGKSSWIVSGRSSYLNSINWLNNSELIQWGLNVNRPREILDEDLINIKTDLVHPYDTDAHFLDLHGKLYFEGVDGNRFIISGYYGGDDTKLEAERLYRAFQTNTQNVELRDVSTENNWDNGAISLQYQDQLSDLIHMQTTAGASVYRSDFVKDDFTYTRLNRDNNTFQIFTFPFENRSILNEIKAEQQVDFNLNNWFMATGISYQYYLGEYFEDSFDRPGFLTSRSSHKGDLFGQIDYSGLNWIKLSAGSRLHYYTNGNYLKWSPRLKLRLFPDTPLSIGGGYSRNFQFLNKISLSNTVTSDVWILVNDEQPPTEVDYYSTGLYFQPANWLYAQIEGYHKEFSNVRLHEINAISLTNTFNQAPWYTDNSGTGRGIEVLVQNKVGNWELSQTFTLSRMQLSNPVINDGEAFYVDWDRRYRYGATLQGETVNNLFIYLSWIYATGTPNRLATFGADNDERLDHYQRLDATLEYKNQFAFGNINISLSIFNLLDLQNPWYRDLTFVLNQQETRNRFRTVPVDVYDIGFQPSFNISVGL